MQQVGRESLNAGLTRPIAGSPAVRNPILSATVLVLAMSGTTSALALDCKLARSVLDRAICGDASALAADKAMTDSFTRLRAKLDAKQATALLANQRQWLTQRNGLCGDDKAGPAACARRESETRARALDARPVSGPGTPDALTPAIVATAGTKKTYAIDIFLYRFAMPKTAGEKRLNADVQAIIANAPKATEDSSGTLTYSFSRTGTLTYASDKLLSLRVEGYTFSGGAHGESTSDNINIDMASGRNLSFDDLIAVPRQKEVIGLCAAQVAAQLKQRLVDAGDYSETNAEAKANLKGLIDGSVEGVEAVTSQLSHWSFTADTATVDYDIDQLAPHVLGAFSCSFPAAQLRPLVKPGFPLP